MHESDKLCGPPVCGSGDGGGVQLDLWLNASHFFPEHLDGHPAAGWKILYNVLISLCGQLPGERRPVFFIQLMDQGLNPVPGACE